jgi:DNA-binding NarL/FixJ family response regulator
VNSAHIARVVVVDDHPLFRRGVVDLLSAKARHLVVGEAESADEIPALVHRTTPDVVLIDIRLGGASGLSVVPALRTTCPRLRIIVLTMFDAPEFQGAARAAGAHGYVTKRDADAVLPRAIQAVLRGESYYPARDGPVPGGGEPPRLTGRETEVIREVAAGHTNRAIAERFGVSIKTVESYRARAMQKLGLSTRADLVRYAVELGMLVGESSVSEE